MNFINHYIAQVFKELNPLRMMRQNAGMQHIGVGHHNMPRLTHLPSRSSRRIAVIGVGLHIHAHRFDQLVKL